jgi:transcriptional regulator with XRE-family HTH domain
MINIGETIVKLRKEKALTQEQLSEVFGVSVAAVSKWETGIAYPDITLLPKIAEFFDVSVDRLLDYDMSKAEANIEEALKKADDLLSVNKHKEAIPYLANLVYKYPNNIAILVKYAKAKWSSAHGRPKNENHRKQFKEAEDILLSINRNGITRKEHDSILQSLYGLYMWDKKFDKVEKIMEELKSDGNYDGDSAEFWFYTHKGDMAKAREKYYDILERNLLWEPLTAGQYHVFYDEPEKVIELNNKFLKVIEIFGEDLKDSGSPSKFSILRESNMFMYLRLGKKDEALAEFEKDINAAKERGESYEQFMEGFTRLANSGEREEYKVFKDTDEFKKLTEKLK